MLRPKTIFDGILLAWRVREWEWELNALEPQFFHGILAPFFFNLWGKNFHLTGIAFLP